MDQAVMDAKEVEDTAKKLRLKLYRTCVKDDLNVSEVFQHVGAEFVRTGTGDGGVADMGDFKPAGADAKMPGANGQQAGAAAAGDKGDKPPQSQQAFKLEAGAKPAVQRTGGKKSLMSQIQ